MDLRGDRDNAEENYDKYLNADKRFYMYETTGRQKMRRNTWKLDDCQKSNEKIWKRS